MNSKKVKKLRQLYNREIRGQIQAIRSLIRPKPKYLPKWIWRKIVYRVLEVQDNSVANTKPKKKAIKFK